MKKNIPFILIFWVFTGAAQQTDNLQQAVNYIQDYYSSFTTGFDISGNYIALSENYKATFSDSIFTLSYDITDANKHYLSEKKTINLKNVLRIEPYGTDVVELTGNDPLILPVCGKLAFITNEEIFEINIYYEVDADVEQSEIFKSFNHLIESYKN